jgi:P27 family predicted phage terminase small subunit
MTTKPPRPPRHLSADARVLFAAVTRDYALEPHQLAVLVKGLEAYDRAEQARRMIAADGLVITSRLGETKAHPAVAIERDSRTAFLAAVKQLGLDVEIVSGSARTAAARAARYSE